MFLRDAVALGLLRPGGGIAVSYALLAGRSAGASPSNSAGSTSNARASLLTVLGWPGLPASRRTTVVPVTPAAAAQGGGGSFVEGALVGVIGAVVGSVVTAGLAAAWAIHQEREHGKRQRASVRALLRIEVEENLAALRPYWSTLSGDAQGDTTGVNVSGTVARRMVQRPLPPWSRLMWEAQAAALAAALSPQEIRAMQRHYANLTSLSAYREKLVDIAHADKAAELAAGEIPAPIRGMAPPRRPAKVYFLIVAERLWPEIERTATELLEHSAPLGPD